MGRFLNSLESTNGKKSLFFCENLLLLIVIGAEDGEEGGDDRINRMHHYSQYHSILIEVVSLFATLDTPAKWNSVCREAIWRKKLANK